MTLKALTNDGLNAPIVASEAVTKKLHKLGLRRQFDLVLHMPIRYEDETHLYAVKEAFLVGRGQAILLEGVVTLCEVSYKPRRQLIAKIEDESGSLFLRFLHFYPNLQTQLLVGKRVRVLGEVKQGYYGLEMIHPKLREVDAISPLAQSLTPVYSTVSGLTQPILRRLIHQTVAVLTLTETVPTQALQKMQLISFAETVQTLHLPPAHYSVATLNHQNHPAWQRLKFDELLAQQLSMRMAYQTRRQVHAPSLVDDGQLRAQLIQQLPFELTGAQHRVLIDILHDMVKNEPMNRLVQGDVGSGKTVVAALAALAAIGAGYQVAFMAPTELLAEQHFRKLAAWLAPLNIEVAWLSGSLSKKQKSLMAERIASGEARLAVGTHALFQDSVIFERLGLAIIDEQHRFGVTQRLALQAKGGGCHQLMMTATPIPRTMAMTFYADLDVSTIDELPPGRTPIVTKLVNAARRDEVIQYVNKACEKGHQVYWVCPLIDESEVLLLQTAIQTQRDLQEALPIWRVGLVHGKLKSAEKMAEMTAFLANDIQVLVATTVIEVGVDVPNASLMVIEHAERMGLSQLHQLRGRVGRGAAKSSCILLFQSPLSDVAKQRLRVIFEEIDGFEVARQDLLIRGPGEFLGTQQSGVPMLRFANLEEDIHLLEGAQRLAPIMLEKFPFFAELHMNRWLFGREQFLHV